MNTRDIIAWTGIAVGLIGSAVALVVGGYIIAEFLYDSMRVAFNF